MSDPLIHGLFAGFVIGVVVCSTFICAVACAVVMYAVHKASWNELKPDDLDGPETPNDI